MIDTDEVREALSYAHTNEEVSAFRATHSVLKRGVKIGSHDHHKRHNFSTVTFGGKIKMDGKDAIVAAVVKQTGKNRLHAQRVLLATEEMLTSFEAKR